MTLLITTIINLTYLTCTIFNTQTTRKRYGLIRLLQKKYFIYHKGDVLRFHLRSLTGYCIFSHFPPKNLPFVKVNVWQLVQFSYVRIIFSDFDMTTKVQKVQIILLLFPIFFIPPKFVTFPHHALQKKKDKHANTTIKSMILLRGGGNCIVTAWEVKLYMLSWMHDPLDSAKIPTGKNNPEKVKTWRCKLNTLNKKVGYPTTSLCKWNEWDGMQFDSKENAAAALTNKTTDRPKEKNRWDNIKEALA